MYDDLGAGHSAKALSRYVGASAWLKGDLPTYLAALAARNLGKNNEAFRYACRAREMTLDPDLNGRVLALLKDLSPVELNTARQDDIPIGFVPPTEGKAE
jgi:hypothetical protein